jgi:hypothetical protein
VAQVWWGYAVRVAHMPREPTPGAIQKEANCADSGKLTTHEWIKYPATPFLGQRDQWHWACTGLSAAERQAGK